MRRIYKARIQLICFYCFIIFFFLLYDLIKKKEEYYEAYANSDCKHKLKFRKTLHKPRSGEDFNKVLMEWFKLRRSEGLPITGRMIQLQAKKYHS